MPENQDYTDVLSQFNVKIRSIEEKERLLKERLLLIGQNLVETREKQGQKISDLKSDVDKIKDELNEIKKSMKRMSRELEKRARKKEVERLEKQAKMFEPLNFARMEDVKKMLEEKNGPD